MTTSKDSVLLPQQPGGTSAGFLMAVMAHALLVIALAFGVNWHASEPEGVQAELWAAVPQIAAPAPQEPSPPQPVVKPQPKPAPPPPPQAKDTRPDAQIAVEQRREKERQLKQQREAELKEKEKEKAKREKEQQLAKQDEQQKLKDQQKQKEEAARIEALRKQNLQRILGQAGATSADATTGNAARNAGPSASYAGRVIARIRPNIVLIDEVQGNPQTDVEVRTSPDGTIVSRTVVKPSGVKEWDEAVLRAIDRTQVLPRDVDGRVPPSMTITFKRN